LVDARLLRLPHGRRGRSGHALAAAASASRLGRPVLTRRRRSDGRVASRERRNRQAARATRCAPGCLSIDRGSEASKTGRLARGTRQRRRVERAQLGTIFRRETPFAEPFSGRFRSARPRARPPMSGRARASSPVARRAHDAAATALTLCISAYVLWVLAVRFPLVRRARPRVSRDPETRHPFSRRADRARALARSPSRTRAPPITHAVLPSALPRAPSPPERHLRTPSRHRINASS